MPRLQAAHEAVGTRVLFLGIDIADRRESALAFLATTGVTFPQVFDEDGEYRAALGVPGVPITLVLDRNGRIVYRRVGEISSEQLQTALNKVGVR